VRQITRFSRPLIVGSRKLLISQGLPFVSNVRPYRDFGVYQFTQLLTDCEPALA